MMKQKKNKQSNYQGLEESNRAMSSQGTTHAEQIYDNFIEKRSQKKTLN